MPLYRGIPGAPALKKGFRALTPRLTISRFGGSPCLK